MNTWFIFLLLILAFELGVVAMRHGKPKNEDYNFWHYLISAFIYIFITFQAIQTGF